MISLAIPSMTRITRGEARRAAWRIPSYINSPPGFRDNMKPALPEPQSPLSSRWRGREIPASPHSLGGTGVLAICALRHSLSRPSNLLSARRLVSGGWKNMLSDVIALGATALFCAFIGWAVVVLTSTRRERLGQRFGFRARRWRSF